MTTRARDTSLEAEGVQIELLRRAPAWRKLQLVDGLNHALYKLAYGVILRQGSPITRGEMRRQLAARRLGPDLVARAYRPTPGDGEPEGGERVELSTIEVALLLIEQLDWLGVPYIVGGSLASSAYGFFRATNDADILADLKHQHAAPLTGALSPHFYVDERMIQDAIQHRASFNAVHLDTMLKVDIFIPRGRAFDRQQLARGISQVVQANPERRAILATAEDTVLAKLEWYRLGGESSDRQWSDIIGVLKVQDATLDLAYLRRWARTLGVADLLARALAEADPG